MEFRDLKKQYEANKHNIDRAVFDAIAEARFIEGRQVTELEKTLAGYVGVRHCITCANGTDALQLALMAWGISKGDAVFVPDFTFFSSGEVVSAVNAAPVFVDVDEKTFNIDPDKLEIAIREVLKRGIHKPRAVIAVDLFGQPADYGRIREIADRYGLLVLEDGAQGFGGRIGSRRACSFGDISTTSFFPAKPLGCYGDGGAIFTDNDEWNELLRSYKVHGKGLSKYDNVRIGMNSRLDTIQAAVLLAKFPVFIGTELEACDKLAEYYTEQLADIVTTPVIKENFFSSWAQYTIKLKDKNERDVLQKYLKENDIPSMIYYQKAMHSQMAFENNNDYALDHSVTEELCKTVLSLPFHSYMTESDAERVVSCIKNYFGE
ncbi:MAG: DegT/DnrJ/EryC1/StrS family aminotransferase [Oscillospiraceae bacterium]|nr:DegT/DnrJ/EryC1/StrS family aminotransferase [Oscillospiraceae bacterium]